MPTPRRAVATISLCLSIALTAAACGGSSGSGGSGLPTPTTATKDKVTPKADALYNEGIALLKQAKQVVLVGDLPPASDSPSHMELTYHNDDIAGTVVFQGAPVQFSKVGRLAYLNAPASFWRTFATNPDDPRVQKLANRWISVPENRTRLGRNLNLQTLVGNLEGDAPSASVPVSTGNLGGIPTYVIKDGTASDGGTLEFASNGPHYLLSLHAVSDGKTADMKFSDYGHTLPITAPQGAVTVQEIAGESVVTA